MPIAMYQVLTDANVKPEHAEKIVVETEKYVSTLVEQAIQPINTRVDSLGENEKVRAESTIEISAIWIAVWVPVLFIIGGCLYTLLSDVMKWLGK